MLEKWNRRNPIVANLFNPAFTGELIRCVLSGYYDENNRNMDFALVFIILPILLHESTNNSLPRNTRKKFYEWYEQSKDLKIHLANRIKEMVPFTQEAICFLLYYNCIEIKESQLCVLPYKKNNSKQSESALKDYKKAKMLGKWLAKSGTTETLYATLGIKP